MIELPDSLDACHILLEQTSDTNESLAKDLERIKFENEELKRYISVGEANGMSKTTRSSRSLMKARPTRARKPLTPTKR